MNNFKTILFHSSWSLTLTSGLSYFFGMLRDRFLAHTFGLSRTLDVYNAAFVIPDMIVLVLIGTALSAAFLPIFSKLYDEKRSLAYAYAHQIMSWGIGIIVFVAIIVAIFLPYFTHWLVPGFEGEDLKQYILLTRIMLFAPILFTLSNTYGRILLSVKEFLWYGLSPAFYNIGIIIGVVLLVPYFGLVGLVFGTLLGVLFHLFIRLFILRRKKYYFRHQINFSYSPEIKETIKLAAPKIIQYIMWHLMILNFTSITSKLPEGSVAVYNYARNFQSLPVSLLGIAIALAMYPTLSHDAGKGNFKKFRHDLKKNRMRSMIYTTLAAITLALLSKPLVTLLLGGGQFGQSDIQLLTSVLMVYCCAVPLESLMHIYHRAYYSLRNTIIPATLHSFIILGTILFAKYLVPTIGIYAIPISFASGLLIQVIILAIIFPIILQKRNDETTKQRSNKIELL